MIFHVLLMENNMLMSKDLSPIRKFAYIFLTTGKREGNRLLGSRQGFSRASVKGVTGSAAMPAPRVQGLDLTPLFGNRCRRAAALQCWI